MRKTFSAALVALAALAAPAAAQQMQHRIQGATTVPTEFGQSAYAAIAEIVAILDADPATDWSRVDVAALREHLVDMDEVMMRAEARLRELDGGFVVELSGAGRTLEAIRRVVPAQAVELAKLPGWQAEATVTDTGVQLLVVGTDPATTARIRGLGVFGVLTTGMHHQPHHLAIAQGRRPH